MTCVDSSFYCKNQTVSPLWPWLPSPKHHFKRGEKQVHFWFLNTCEQFNTNTYQDLENTSRYSWADNHSVPCLFRMASLWDIHAHKGDGRRETGASVCEAEGPWAKHRGRGTPVLCTSLTLTTTVRAATLTALRLLKPWQGSSTFNTILPGSTRVPLPLQNWLRPKRLSVKLKPTLHKHSHFFSFRNGPRSKNSIREWEGQKREPRAVGQVPVPLTGD